MSSLLSVHNLSFSYQNKPALQPLSFELARGEVLAFLGLNGAGKSTALNLISGVLPLNASASVRINHYDLQSQTLQAKACLGYLPENPPLYPQMRVQAYLQFAGELRGLRGKALQGALAWVLERCGLESVAGVWIKHLSQGFRQRVGIAQALIHQPAVILLDEPTVGLDPQQRKQSLDLIKALAEDHAVIFSTHILSEVQQIASHVQILEDGQLRLEKTALASTTRPRLLLGLDVALSAELQQALRALPAITGLSAQANGVWQVFYAASSEAKTVAKTLSAWAVSQQLGLFSLQPAASDLEQVFLQSIEVESHDSAVA